MADFKTIVLSDVHLGTQDAKSKELAKFLKHNHARRLILNGDIFDLLKVKIGGVWPTEITDELATEKLRQCMDGHPKFVNALKEFVAKERRRILEMIEKHHTQVIYVRGNHDDFLDKMIPLAFGNIRIVDNYDLVSNGRKYFVTHGDIFDVVSSQFTWLARVGDVGYKFLLWLNRRHNKRRALRGLPYDSVSQKIKNRVKLALNYISDFEQVMVNYAGKKGYGGVICGHIHKPENKMIGDIHYLNSGDWVETLSALVEDEQGNWKVIYFDTVMESEEFEKEEVVFIPAELLEQA